MVEDKVREILGDVAAEDEEVGIWINKCSLEKYEKLSPRNL